MPAFQSLDRISPEHVHFFLCLAASWIIIYAYFRLKSTSKKSPPLPPGPARKPIIGNVLDMPTEHLWVKMKEWALEYGDLVYLEILGQPMVFINNYKTAIDLLEKRSRIYSDRPENVMFGELCGSNISFILMRYGEEWRTNRKMFHQEFNSGNVQNFKPAQATHIHAAMKRFWNSPSEWHEHFKTLSTATIMGTTYGIDIASKDDPFVSIAYEAVERSNKAGQPGAWLVDLIPILKYVPKWFPGAYFKIFAEQTKQAVDRMRFEPFKVAKKAFDDGAAPRSFTSIMLGKISVIQDDGKRAEMEGVIRDVGATAYGAGFETTTSTMCSFMLAMMENPKCQEKAQEELTRVVGRDRMPDWSDLEDLPYLEAIFNEVLRWNPALPNGFPHRVLVDDIYQGLRIPKGTLVIPNAWHMLHNESDYGPDPYMFIPERFLQPGVANPASVAFGFGRRICPGRYFAVNSVRMTMASILHLFTIGKPKNAAGEIVDPEISFSPHFLRHPLPFECDIKVKDADAMRLLQSL